MRVKINTRDVVASVGIVLGIIIAISAGYLAGRDVRISADALGAYAASPLNGCDDLPDHLKAGCRGWTNAQAEASAHQDLSLRADQRSANSALLAAVISAFGLVVSGVGIVALLKQIELTRDALAIARDANTIASRSLKLEHRPYLVPEFQSANVQRWLNGNEDPLSCQICFVNQGRGAAFLECVIVECVLSDILPPVAGAIRPALTGQEWQSGLLRDGPERRPEWQNPYQTIRPEASSTMFEARGSRAISRNLQLPPEEAQRRLGMRMNISGGRLRIWVMGLAQYRDTEQNVYQIHFCWLLSQPFGKVIVEGGKAYNFAVEGEELIRIPFP